MRDCGRRPSQPSRRCGSRPAALGCQPFPSNGPLWRNRDWSLAELREKLAGEDGDVYAYIVASVGWGDEGEQFEQRATAPNFQGGVLTLCTCKHPMRASRAAGDWEGCWIAGFTSVNTIPGRRGHWLFYLAQIEHAEDSMDQLWKALTQAQRAAKEAHRHNLGDVYAPRDGRRALTDRERWSPESYRAPCPGHDHEGIWADDVRLYQGTRQPAMLVAAPRATYLWSRPEIRSSQDSWLGRGYRRPSSIDDLLDRLV